MEPTGHHDTSTAKGRRQTPPDEAPECYGSGKIKVYLRGYAGYNYYRVSPRHCYSCPVERRCLAQQRRRH